jgi:hypothetical protein
MITSLRTSVRLVQIEKHASKNHNIDRLRLSGPIKETPPNPESRHMAKRVRVKLKRCIQNSHEAGSDDTHMISRVFYELVVNGNKQGSFYSDIKQSVGSEYDAEDLEVTAPHGYTGPINHERFAQGIRNYYQRLVGPKGSAPSYGGTKSVVMKNKTIVMDTEFEFEADA